MANELVGAPVIQILINKLISAASKPINLVWHFKDEMTKLHRTLISIQAVLCDAEKKREENQLVKNWLRDLKDAAYDAEDVFDELEYEALRHKIEIQGRKRKKVKNFFSSSNTLKFRLKMANKIKDINQMLDQIAKDMERFNFVEGSTTTTVGNASTSRETHSVLDESEVVGRKHDKSNIIDWLIDSSTNEEIYSIVRIISIGGVGKTTLAKLVFKDKLVTDHFDKQVWVCVSQNSNEKEIYRKLLESIDGDKISGSSLELIVKKLKQELGKKRYLIVLDDVWDHENMNLDDILKNLLYIAAKGSKVIVTARSYEVASINMGFVHTHHLVGLPEEESWTIFEQIAFGHGGAEKTPNLIKIGKDIVKKCGGVPLATKTLGRLMYSKKEEDEWLSILKKEIWNLPEGENKIISVLKLSYNHLPAYLKQCFSYCSIFPKDHNINKKKLIQLCMAEGFLSASKESKLPGNIDNEYFDILVQNSFLQVEERNKWGDVKSYKMHDLVHDLAVFVVGTEFSDLDFGRIQEEKEIAGLRRVRLVSESKLSTIPEVMYEARKLRTFVTSNLIYGRNMVVKVSNDMFLKWRFLRVLDLSYTKIQELPPSIGKLKHLRYLDLSYTNLKTLPDSCTNLYLLQTLKLMSCYSFEEFPKYMSKLVNLKYLKFSRYKVDEASHLIRKVGELSQLQKLSKFVVGKDEGFGIEELKDLNLLEGKLEIHNLENVRDARGENLKEKQYIRSLELLRGYTYEVVEDDYAVFEGLQPNKNLKKLRIYGFAALNFPIWMTSASVDCLPNLISVTLECCCSCEHLPSLGQLPFLKFLKIYGMDSLKRIGSEFYRSSERSAMRVAATNISFPSLKELYLECMSNLEEWLGDQLSSSFPCLVKLVINDCPKVKIAPALFPSLKTLVSDQQNGISLMSMVESNLASLTFIRIRGCTELKFLPQVLLQGNNVLGHLEIFNCKDLEAFVSTQEHVEAQQLQELSSNKSLHELSVRHCPSLKSVPDLWGFNSLRILTITGCGSVKSLPDGIQCLPILEELSIGPFSEDLETFPFPALSSDGTQQHFVSLRVLSIHGWTCLMSLPDGLQYLTSLQELAVYNFGSLEALPEWLGNLTSLQTLGILYFNKLNYLPSQEQMLRLTALQTLEIGGCPVLEKKCLSDDPDEARKTEHIPNRLIEYTGAVPCSGFREGQHSITTLFKKNSKCEGISVGNWVIKSVPRCFEGDVKRKYGGQEAADD